MYSLATTSAGRNIEKVQVVGFMRAALFFGQLAEIYITVCTKPNETGLYQIRAWHKDKPKYFNSEHVDSSANGGMIWELFAKAAFPSELNFDLLVPIWIFYELTFIMEFSNMNNKRLGEFVHLEYSRCRGDRIIMISFSQNP